MELKGKIHEIGQIQQVSETFKKRDLIVEYADNPSYPEYIKFETLQDKTSLLDALKVGDEVEVSFNLRGRPWTDKTGKVSYFNSMVVWRLNKLGANGGVTQPAQSENAGSQYAPPADLSNNQGEDDDLPF